MNNDSANRTQAVGIICEYLDPESRDLLLSNLGLKAEDLIKAPQTEDPSKKRDLGDEVSEKKKSVKKRTKVMTAPVGVKSLTHYFSK